MIECKICGHKVKYRLIEHIQKIHKMNISFYKNNYGDVVSIEYKEKVSNKSKEKWQEDDYRNRTIESREWIYSDKNIKNKISSSLKEFYENGGITWNKGLTKETDIRLLSVGEKNKELFSGRNKENYDYLKRHSNLMKKLWENSNFKKRKEEICNDPELKKEWASKISETISLRILNGELSGNNYKFFKTGWYENDFGKYWYDSGLELESMKLMDSLNIEWYKNNKIKIKYNINGSEHNYIPDFIVKMKYKEYIIEMKGYDWDGSVKIKEEEEAIKIYDNYKIFYKIEDLEAFLKN